MRKKRHLTIDEKRDWLATVFRDDSGEFSQADKFKAMVEDTKLATLLAEEEQQKTAPPPPPQDPADTVRWDLLEHLPPAPPEWG